MAASPLLLPFCLGLLSPGPLWAAGNGLSDPSNSVPRAAKLAIVSVGPMYLSFCAILARIARPAVAFTDCPMDHISAGQRTVPRGKAHSPLGCCIAVGDIPFRVRFGLTFHASCSVLLVAREARKKANSSETGQCLVLNGPLRVHRGFSRVQPH